MKPLSRLPLSRSRSGIINKQKGMAASSNSSFHAQQGDGGGGGGSSSSSYYMYQASPQSFLHSSQVSWMKQHQQGRNSETDSMDGQEQQQQAQGDHIPMKGYMHATRAANRPQYVSESEPSASEGELSSVNSDLGGLPSAFRPVRSSPTSGSTKEALTDLQAKAGGKSGCLNNMSIIFPRRKAAKSEEITLPSCTRPFPFAFLASFQTCCAASASHCPLCCAPPCCLFWMRANFLCKSMVSFHPNIFSTKCSHHLDSFLWLLSRSFHLTDLCILASQMELQQHKGLC